MDSRPTQSVPEPISAKLRTILLGLRAAIAAWRLEGMLAVALCNRIGQVAGRIERMLLRFRAGRLRPVTQPAALPRQPACRPPGIRMPRKFGWLLIAGKHHAGYFHAQLRDLLATPEMAELLAASPQAVRLLRPVCRALAVELPATTAATKPSERPPRKRQPRPKPEPFRIPLPRGVLSWARREGFGKIR